MSRIVTVLTNTIRSFANPIFNFLIIILGVKNFGKENWGSLINVMLWVFFIVFIFSWGNREYLIRKYSKYPSNIFHSFYSNLISRGILLPFSFILLLFFPFEISIWCIVLIVLNYFYNSLDSLIVYHQKFSVQFFAEFISFCLLLFYIFHLRKFDLLFFIQLYCISSSLRVLFLVFTLQFWKQKFSFEFSLNEFKLGFPFFILGLSGWLMSKIDIYIVDLYLPKSKLSEYQIFITTFLMLQAFSGFIMVPITKHIYRLPKNIVQKIKIKLYYIAIPVVLLGCLIIFVVMEQFIELNFKYYYYILGFFIALPTFFYTINAMELIKENKEHKIILINLLGFIINSIFILLLISKHQVFGVLLSVCITQWFTLFMYKFNKT
jgi:O-antigen/teichoic acid export membrane protein